MTIEDLKGRGSNWAGRQVLVLSPTPTLPIDFGNRRRIFFLCKRLQDLGASVTFVHYPAEADWRDQLPVEAERGMMAQWDGYYVVPPTRPLHPPPASGFYHGVDEWWDPAIGTFLSWLFAVRSFDVFIVNYAWLSHAFTYAPSHTTKILDTHDKLSGRREMLTGQGIAPEFFYVTDADERVALDRADLIWAIKPHEQVEFQAMTQRPVLTILHAEPPAPARWAAQFAPLRFGLFGARNNVNRVNFRAFLKAAHDYMRRTLLPCEIVVAGTCCKDLEDISFPFLRKLGRVKHVREFYESVDVVLGAIAFSTGLKIKIGEALSFGKPVISHVHCFEGYVPSHPFHTLPSFNDMLAACRAVIRNPSLLEQLASASAQSLRLVEMSVAGNVELTLSPETVLRNRVVIVVDAADMDPADWRYDHAREVAEYISFQTPVAFYLVGKGASATAAAIAGLRRFGPVFTLPETLMNGSVLPPLASLSFAALLGCEIFGLWLAALPDSHGLQRTDVAAWAPIAVLAATGEDGVLTGLQRLSRVLPRLSLLVTEEGKGSASLTRLQRGKLRVPVLWRGHSSAVLAALTCAERRRVLILGCAADPFLPSALSAAALSSRRPVDLVIDGDEGSFVCPSEFQIDVTVHTLAAYQAGLIERKTGPLIVVQVGEGMAFAALRELYRRAGLPTLRVFAPGAPVAEWTQPGMDWVSDPAASILTISTLLCAEWRLAALRRHQISADEYANDAGWTFIWDEIGALVRWAEAHPTDGRLLT